MQAQILDLIRKLQRDHGSAIVFITHDMGVIAEIADRVMVMYAGRIVERAREKRDLLRPRIPIPRACSIRSRRWKGRGRSGSVHSGVAAIARRWPQGCAFGPRCRPGSLIAANGRDASAGEREVPCCIEPADRADARAHMLNDTDHRHDSPSFSHRPIAEPLLSVDGLQAFHRRQDDFPGEGRSCTPSTASPSMCMPGETLGLVGEIGLRKIDARPLPGAAI